MSTIARPRRRNRIAAPPKPQPSVIPGEQRIAIRGVSWDLYDRLSEAIDEHQHVRLAYDGKDLEIMSTSLYHEDFKDLLGQLVNAITDDLHILRRGAGQSTWKREAIQRGIEADLCYYFDREKLAIVNQSRARKSKDIGDYPNPDLAVEIDISPPQIDRPSIYAALQVAELWRFDGESMRFEQLGPDGKYFPVNSSRFLPIRPEEVIRWVVEENTDDLAEWRARLRDWILAELAPRLNPTQPARREGSRRRPAP